MVDASVPDSVKTVRVNFIENRARYVNPQLSPQLTDKLRQKIIGQTRLTQVNNDNAHYEISGSVTDYSVSTSAISGQQTTNNRLSVTIHIILLKRLENKTDEFDVTRSFEFDARQTLTQAETALKDEMIRNLVEEIFNRIFSNW
ncbi:MAG: hypothetical protein EPO57_08225 [Chitinophagaceae bacterium]|nr:MAG: hypothetical protein EPO57_08225 [Chitinophagaceae bacterium]